MRTGVGSHLNAEAQWGGIYFFEERSRNVNMIASLPFKRSNMEATPPFAVAGKRAEPPSSDAPGLTAAEARAQLAQLGPNAVREERPHPLRQFLRRFWTPIPAGAPEPPPNLPHTTKWKDWLFRAGKDPNVDSLSVLGNVLEEFMDIGPKEDPQKFAEWKTNRARVVQVLEENGFRSPGSNTRRSNAISALSLA